MLIDFHLGNNGMPWETNMNTECSRMCRVLSVLIGQDTKLLDEGIEGRARGLGLAHHHGLGHGSPLVYGVGVFARLLAGVHDDVQGAVLRLHKQQAGGGDALFVSNLGPNFLHCVCKGDGKGDGGAVLSSQDDRGGGFKGCC